MAEQQRDWDRHFPLALQAYRSPVQESTFCTPALLMLGRCGRWKKCRFGNLLMPQGVHQDQNTLLQDQMEAAHAFARDHRLLAGVRQRRNYDVRARGRDFGAGDLVWV